MTPTEAFQRAFAAHLRNPDINPPPAGVDVERAGIYVELLFNNVEDFLSGCFPVLRSILDDATWKTLVRQFYAGHACTTPYFREIPAEFVQWLSSTNLSPPLPAFTLELAHYEWVEISLLLDDSVIDWQHIDTNGDLLEGIPALNPVMLLQSYQYPVHRINPAYQPETPEPTHLLLLRNRHNVLDFVVLNAVTARFIQLLQAEFSGRAAINCIAEEIQHSDLTQLLQFGLQLLTQFKHQDVLLGATIRQLK